MTDAGATFAQFLLWERASRDTLEVKRIYVDMAGDLVAGLVLSQIVYWHLPNREGKARLRVEREGDLWLAKRRAEWWDECRISPKQADRALDVLQARNLIEVRLFKFGSAPTKHIRILRDSFLHAWKTQLMTNGECGQLGRENDPDFSEASQSILTKAQNPIRPKGEIHFDQRDRSLTETTTEITAAAPERKFDPDTKSSAAAALTDELVAHGVSRSTARRLANEKPDVCRRSLEYLPYANYRTTKGAWLANAIKHEFGPPAAYEKAMARRITEQQARKRQQAENARKSREEARSNKKAARLMEKYRCMEAQQGEVYRAFTEHLERQRAQAAKVAAHLSDARRAKYLAAFDSTDRRLEIFENWLRLNPSPEPVSAMPGLPI
jgi:hypothetical protein